MKIYVSVSLLLFSLCFANAQYANLRPRNPSVASNTLRMRPPADGYNYGVRFGSPPISPRNMFVDMAVNQVLNNVLPRFANARLFKVAIKPLGFIALGVTTAVVAAGITIIGTYGLGFALDLLKTFLEKVKIAGYY